MAIHVQPFPFKIMGIFKTQLEAYLSGWTACRTWAVFENESAIGYVPPHHVTTCYVVTDEQHDCSTYYEEAIK